MLTLAQIRDWLKDLYPAADHYYIGRLDESKEKSVGVYSLKYGDSTGQAISGADFTRVKPVTILMHWTPNANETELAAADLFSRIMGADHPVIGEIIINYIKLPEREPIDVTGDGRVYERVIDALFYY